MADCTEKLGNRVERTIGGLFSKVGLHVGLHPRKTILFSILLTAICGSGFVRWNTENREEKLWVPQNTLTEKETERYENYFESMSRLNMMIVQADISGENVLTKERMVDAMKMHTQIATGVATVTMEDKNTTYAFTDLCTKAGGVCADPLAPSFDAPICKCLVTGIFKQWNYDLETLENDEDFLATLNGAYSRAEMEAVFGNPKFDANDTIETAEAFTLSYFVTDRSLDAEGSEEDPINEGWELDVFINATEVVPTEFPTLSVDYLAGRSFSDEFGGAITGDLLLVQVSYAVVFIFLALTLGNLKPGVGSRQTLSWAALVLVVLSTAACFGVSSGVGLFYGPVHALLPFILLGVGVDDAFVIVNAFNRERKVSRNLESNEDIAERSARAMARAGASITVTSLTDLVAFGISASSSLPALASFCAYAAIGIVFLWIFSATFFAACLVLDERRQRDNRREFLCCLTRKNVNEEESGQFEEGGVSRYFRNYHAPAILSRVGKLVVVVLFSTVLGFGIYGAINLSVENTERSFVPPDSYLTSFLNQIDAYYPSTGVDVSIVFEDESEIYKKKEVLATLDDRLMNLSDKKPYIAEPTTDSAYQNVMDGLATYLTLSTTDLGNVTLGTDNWPAEEDFVTTLKAYVLTKEGSKYFQDIKFSEDGSKVLAIRVSTQLVALNKKKRNGDVIDDSDKQIEAMDGYRALVEDWGDDVPAGTFIYSERFFAVEGFKIIRQELFTNVGLALAAVAVIVLLTVASPITAALITLNVAACIVEILGAMYYIGIAIDSVSVINIVLAVGLSIDYSAHVGHCFMMKGGDNKDRRVLESLADIGAAVLSGATTTFLAVVVLLFSSSYVFKILSQQFAITVGLGAMHGLVLLPVLLSLFGPKAFESAEVPVGKSKVCKDVSQENDLALEEEQNEA